MQGAVWILLVTVLVGVILYLHDRHQLKKEKGERFYSLPDNSEKPNAQPQEQSDTSDIDDRVSDDENGGVCCGMHLVCEKDSLSPVSSNIEYYDDEELDRFIGRDGNDYTQEETDEFRDVMMTLRPDDIAGWARSITARRLILPPDVRDELLLLVNDLRAR